eukprot:jgi/Psemu1/242883/estExt_Genewise1.C_3110001
MDNALDAESTTIKIRLFGQGLDIIEVSDDGNGVPEGSLPYVATRHATSKIERLDDIYSGTGLTMGFRGEALFATACVSDSLVVASRTNEQELATKLVFGTDGRPLLLARKVGTTVAVVGPFGRLPARRADLVRRIKDERTKIFKLVEAYGIFNVGVSFHLIDIINNNNNTKHNTKHNNTKNNNNHNHNTNHNTNQREEAVLQTSARSRGGANNRVRSVQYYSINGRIVLLPKVTAILKKLWTNACTQCSTAANMKPPKKPSALLAFTLPNRAFDINLSPDKKEVLFTDEDELMGILEEHVARMWSGSRRRILVVPRLCRSEQQLPLQTALQTKPGGRGAGQRRGNPQQQQHQQHHQRLRLELQEARTERLNMRKRKQELHDIRRLVKSRARDEHGNESEQEQEHPDSTNEIRTRTRTEAKSDEEEDDDDNAGGDSFIRISKSTFRSGMKVIGQFNLGFILAICPQNHLWILDQHACDEKYNFEQLCKTTVLHVQPLIRPLPLELTPSEEACVLDHRDIFATNGFKFEFDPGAPIRHRLSLTSLPHSGAREGRKAVGFGPADVSTLCAVLTEGTTRDNANADRLLTRLPKAVAMFASRACRTSIMIGTALSQKEMAAIVKKLSATDSPWNCPHGRPTMPHVKNVLPLLWKDERRAAEHVALRSIHP